jgi:G:T/U-mismatch repair DNA glycosylase
MAAADKGRAEPATNRRETGGPRGLDWPALRARFVAGDETLEAFAKREGIASSTVRERAKREGWQAQRKAAGEKVAAGTVAAVVKQRIRSETYIDGQAHRAAVRFGGSVRGMLVGPNGEPVQVSLDDAPKVKAAVEALEKLHRLARITAHLPAEPAAAAVNDGPEGEIVVRRRRPDGSAVEVTLAADAAPRGGPDGLHADGDSVAVPVGRDEPHQGDDRRARQRQEQDGRRGVR